MLKEFFSGLAIGLTVVIFVPYMISIHRGKTKPHVFSWVIWAIGTLTVFFAQLTGFAGIGAWPIGVSGVMTSYIAVLAYTKKSDNSISKSDWVFLFFALTALSTWFFTSDPQWAVIILTFVDVVGFGPTIKKAYNYPHEESVSFFTMTAIRNFFVIIALEYYSITTVLFPAIVGLACLLLVLLLLYRRRILQTISNINTDNK